uniref:Uncharacterized protein MANES_14G117000 n=1 Tax=Rhizophora mucronata TaxID=61149 RepID=A0A2P2KV26_RHIMU
MPMDGNWPDWLATTNLLSQNLGHLNYVAKSTINKFRDVRPQMFFWNVFILWPKRYTDDISTTALPHLIHIILQVSKSQHLGGFTITPINIRS